MIQNMDHFNMTVSDLDRSVEFYQRAFGFEIDRRFETESPAIAQLSRFDRLHMKMAILTLGTTRIGLLQYLNPRSTTGVRLKMNDVGGNILVFNTDDVRAEYHRLFEMGVEFKTEPLTDPQAGIVAAQGLDPDGVTFEIVERV